MTTSKNKSTGISAKCLKGMSRFLGANGKLYPCCFVYTNHADWNAWCEKYGVDTEQNNLNKYTHEQIMDSVMKTLVDSNFDMETCDRECGVDGYNSELSNQPKWNHYVNK